MKFRDFLRHKIPTGEIIRGDYMQLKHLISQAEQFGVIIRHGYESRYHKGEVRKRRKFYKGDKSYPPTNPQNRQLIPLNFNRLYVVNCKIKDKNVVALPRGVYPDQYPWRITWANPNRPKTRLLYCNFSLGSKKQKQLKYRKRRQEVYDSLRDKSWITFENMGNLFGKYDLTRFQFYKSVSKHMFTISPQGNGIDCHRTWEALYLKSIPIVQTSSEMKHFKNLPILYTDNYKELTPEYLKEQYNLMLNVDYHIEKLYISYWKRLIEKDIAIYSPKKSLESNLLKKIMLKIKLASLLGLNK